MEVRDALALHDRLLALHGGAMGLRSDALLKSALARQVLTILKANSYSIGRKSGEMCTAPTLLQPISFKSDRLPGFTKLRYCAAAPMRRYLAT